MGMRPWGYMQEEVRKEEEGGEGEEKRWDFHLKSNNPSLRGGEQGKNELKTRTQNKHHFGFILGSF